MLAATSPDRGCYSSLRSGFSGAPRLDILDIRPCEELSLSDSRWHVSPFDYLAIGIGSISRRASAKQTRRRSQVLLPSASMSQKHQHIKRHLSGPANLRPRSIAFQMFTKKWERYERRVQHVISRCLFARSFFIIFHCSRVLFSHPSFQFSIPGRV